MENNKKTINAIHERDINFLLEKLNIKEEFDKCKLKCKFCKNIINKENIYSFFSESGGTKLICDNPECITNMLSYIEEKKKKKVVN